MALKRGSLAWDPQLVRETVDRLEVIYGREDHHARFDPIEELVSCILSQHTTDATSFPAFDRLRERFPDWGDMENAPAEQIATIIRSAGLANQKAARIKSALHHIRTEFGTYSLDALRSMPMLQARNWLTNLPGVGPKTASIVLCFAFGMPAIPVDTHIFRVSWRLGLIHKSMGEARAHDVLLDLVPGELAFRLHVALIKHGRRICRAPIPKCAMCPITDNCRWFQANKGKAPSGAKAEAAAE